MRLAQMQVWPALRYFEAIVPSTACSSGGVVEDDVRGMAAELEREPLHLAAAARISSLPTSVEPVNEILRTRAVAEERLRDHPGRA